MPLMAYFLDNIGQGMTRDFKLASFELFKISDLKFDIFEINQSWFQAMQEFSQLRPLDYILLQSSVTRHIKQSIQVSKQ